MDMITIAQQLVEGFSAKYALDHNVRALPFHTFRWSAEKDNSEALFAQWTQGLGAYRRIYTDLCDAIPTYADIHQHISTKITFSEGTPIVLQLALLTDDEACRSFAYTLCQLPLARRIMTEYGFAEIHIYRYDWQTGDYATQEPLVKIQQNHLMRQRQPQYRLRRISRRCRVRFVRSSGVQRFYDQYL